MTLEEIKEQIRRQGWTVKALAEKLSMSKDAVSRVLSGKNRLSDTLRKHLELILAPGRSLMFVYQVELPAADVKRLLGVAEHTMTEAEKKACLEGILRDNIMELAKLGSTVACWSDETRAALGLPPNGEPWEPSPSDFGD